MNSKEKNEHDPDYAVPPGETLLETMEHLELSRQELAQRMDCSVKTVHQLAQGKARLTAETALKLEKITGIHRSFWNNAEANYRKRLTKNLKRRRIMANEDNEDERIDILIENTAQSVLNNLKALKSNQAHARTRWVWELLQNARDAGSDVVSVKHDEDKVVFRHNEDGFTRKEIGHLIHHGSTKTDDDEKIGQYGSGFLTTHLLSPEIKVSGRLKDDGRRFQFRLRRDYRDSVDDLSASMKRAWQDFLVSLNRFPVSDDSGTEFIYPLDIDVSDAIEAVKYGIDMLKRCAPFVVVFNEVFSSIEIETRSETISFKAARRCPLAKERGLYEVVVEETANQNRKERKYILAKSESAQVAIPLESKGGVTVCAPIREIPKLFLGFPLIGTADFGFPAIINSLSFTPTEPRDGVYIGRSRDKANTQNQKAVEEACGLLVDLIEFAAESGWRNICELARVPPIVHRDWLNPSWLKSTTDRLLVEKIRVKAIALNGGAGERIPPNVLKLPFANSPEAVLTLWDLLADWNDYKEVLPRRDEAVGWRDAVESWAGSLALTYREVIGGNGVAELVHNASRNPSATDATHLVSRLELKECVDPIDWLNKLSAFLIENGFRDSLLRYRIVPSQAEVLNILPRLHRDMGIDKELKAIADLADEWRVRPKLRDSGIASLSAEVGAGEWGDTDVLRSLIGKLNARAKTNPDAICFEASKRLFAWIAERQDWDTLRTLPMFSAEYESANRQMSRAVLNLDPNQENLPLAPVDSWEKGLKPYSELFPMRHTLADFYFDAVPDRETWDTLDREGFVRKSVIVKNEVHLTRFREDDLSDEDEHRTSERVPVTDIAFRTSGDIGIMARARQTRERARRFWGFVTKWLIHKDPNGLEVKQASCVCGKKHGYYPAEWIAPLRENKWIPIEGTRSARQATAQSLADLLCGGDWTPDALNDSLATVKLLKAIGVTQFDLTRSFMARTDEERAEQDRVLTNIMVSTGGDIKDLKIVNEFAEERRKRLRIVRGNQHLGAHVEKLVKKNLKGKGFIVKRTHVGADYEIKLELASDSKTWLVEVKATRDQRVRMTDTQARTAVSEGDRFLLCVVPLDSEQSEPTLDEVRSSMRFVSNIGKRLVSLCGDLDELVELRKDIIAGDSNGVQLEVESGAAHVRVASSVWQDEGFPLAELSNRLN